MNLPSEAHSRGLVLVADVLGIRADPVLLQLLGSVAHVLGQHEMPVIQEARMNAPARDPAVDYRSVGPNSLEGQQRALAWFRCKEVISMVQVQELDIRLKHAPCRLNQVGCGSNRQGRDDDRRDVKDKPDVHCPSKPTAVRATARSSRLESKLFVILGRAHLETSSMTAIELRKKSRERRVHPSFRS